MKLWILSPSFFDTDSYRRLSLEIDAIDFNQTEISSIQKILIDDSAGLDPSIATLDQSIRVLDTPYNLGHQSALVFALRKILPEVNEEDLLVTLDADGEDRPSDILTLVQKLISQKDEPVSVVLAERTKREEGLFFKTLYLLFKVFYKTLTGTIIRTGNFLAIRGSDLGKIIYHPAFNFCYSSSFHVIPMRKLLQPLPRGKRFFGKSKMNLIDLISHGLRMLIPFAPKITVTYMIFFLISSGVLSLTQIFLGITLGSSQILSMMNLIALIFSLSAFSFMCLGFLVFHCAYHLNVQDNSVKARRDYFRTKK